MAATAKLEWDDIIFNSASYICLFLKKSPKVSLVPCGSDKHIYKENKPQKLEDALRRRGKQGTQGTQWRHERHETHVTQGWLGQQF